MPDLPKRRFTMDSRGPISWVASSRATSSSVRAARLQHFEQTRGGHERSRVWGERMEISLVTPAPEQSRAGNRTTALRWAWLPRDLGHDVRRAVTYDDEQADIWRRIGGENQKAKKRLS